MLRLFTAIALPQELRARLALLQGGIPGARWSPLENFHVTLTFLGEADDNMAEDIDEALSSVHGQKFSLRLSGTGSFAQGDWPQVLWAGVEKNEALTRLKEKSDRALESLRVPFEKRKYTPHVTLARLKDPDMPSLAHFLQQHAAFTAEPFEVDEFALYQSVQTKHGYFYEALKTYSLA